MSRIIILEDDEYIRESLQKVLMQQGFEVDEAGNVETFFRYIERNDNYDVYLVDVKLPDGNGFDVCQKLRQSSSAVIIFLTSCDDEESIIKGLDIGADDYVVKPFRVAELLSRIQANLRSREFAYASGKSDYTNKENMVESRDVKCADITINYERYEVIKNGEVVNLSPMEFELLNLLVINSGIIIRRETLLERLWDSSGNFVEDGTLTVAISRLKSKLGNNKEGKSYIETIRKVGYRWR